MIIEILGTGCNSCKKTIELVRKAVEETGVEADVKEVKEVDEIVKRGVMMTPAVVINGEVKIGGRIPSLNELKRLIK